MTMLQKRGSTASVGGRLRAFARVASPTRTRGCSNSVALAAFAVLAARARQTLQVLITWTEKSTPTVFGGLTVGAIQF